MSVNIKDLITEALFDIIQDKESQLQELAESGHLIPIFDPNYKYYEPLEYKTDEHMITKEYDQVESELEAANLLFKKLS